jgi:GT2 family glycosyltransferase
VPSRSFLLAILVYNGREVVLPCIESAARLISKNVDVMVFDDCSPIEGWSDELATLCLAKGVGYYRSPRNLGIPRNMSLAMSVGETNGYDVVGLVNSDVILPSNLCTVADIVFDTDPMIGSITPWSNNVSAFSLPLDGDPSLVADQRFVDEFSSLLAGSHEAESIVLPTGVGYCMLLRAEAIRSIGVMDPIFGRGYCEEVDWCQRSAAAGFKNVLAPGAYVYHAGSGTNRDEGLLAHGMTTVPEHEQIILGRYPTYIARVQAFLDEGVVEQKGKEAVASTMRAMCRSRGYTVVLSDAGIFTDDGSPVVTLRVGAGAGPSSIEIGGLHSTFALGGLWQPEVLVREFGKPTRVVVYEPGILSLGFSSWARTNGVVVDQNVSYPGTV